MEAGARLTHAAAQHGPAWWRRALALLIVSALLTAFSETFYWYSGGTDYPGRVLFYLIPTTALLWTTGRWPGSRWPTVVLVGAVYGFITEGVLTAVVYGGFPFDPFAISYTSLAWHALISVGFGLVLMHRLLAGGSLAQAAAAIALFGAFWGTWATTLRLPASDGDELPALAALIGDVGTGSFAPTRSRRRRRSAPATSCSARSFAPATSRPDGSGRASSLSSARSGSQSSSSRPSPGLRSNWRRCSASAPGR